MRRYFLFLSILLFLIVSCNKKIKYSGLNDLVIGAQDVIFYEDGEFQLELSLGNVKGKYVEKNDTFLLKYYNKPDNNWPDTLILEKDKFVSKYKKISIQRININ
jgi:hypothetical protein